MTHLYDITLEISESLATWPGDPPVQIRRMGSDGGEVASFSELCLSTHAGTHVDPPAHFLPAGTTVDRLPLERLIGQAWVAHVAGPGPISGDILGRAAIPDGTERLLLRTENSERLDVGARFDPDFVGLDASAATWLLAREILLVGIDGPSIEPYDSPGEPVHRRLLAAGVILVENLALAGITPGAYRLCCLPLRLQGGDGAPARAVLISDV